MSAHAPTVAPMSRYRAAVPHVCSRPPAGRRLLAERPLLRAALTGTLLGVLAAATLLPVLLPVPA